MASNGKVALVTGGGSGIGKASALALAREGFAVVVAGRRPEPLQAVVGEIEGLQGKALGVPTDVGDPASVEALFAKTKATVRPARRAVQQCRVRRRRADRGAAVRALEGGRRLDRERHVPVHPAGVPDDEGPERRWAAGSSTTARSRRMCRGRNSVAYTSAKHAVTGLTKSTSLDGRKYDISCGQIDVGNALTEMTQRMTRGVPQANGEVMIEPTMDVENVARSVVLMRDRDAGGQRPVPDRDGDQDAVRRPRLARAQFRRYPVTTTLRHPGEGRGPGFRRF